MIGLMDQAGCGFFATGFRDHGLAMAAMLALSGSALKECGLYVHCSALMSWQRHMRGCGHCGRYW
jgi:NADH pyrophosphatase NudC (nudix superfamily)